MVHLANAMTASIVDLHKPRTAQTGAQRARAYRERKREQGAPQAVAEHSVEPDERNVVTSQAVTSRWQTAPILLCAAGAALATVGITMNGWFARSLGSSDVAGWLFLAVGVAADLVALVMPSCAAGLWRTGRRVASLAGWLVWTVTFVFAVTAGIGFAAVNIVDVTAVRAARVTPALAVAQASLDDAMKSRDRECQGGVGRFCRDREAAVADRRQSLDTAMASVGRNADPQTEAAIKLMAWITHGVARPSAEDFGMLRLVLLVMLPQMGGMLLMVARSPNREGHFLSDAPA
jgi:hypothetical protein